MSASKQAGLSAFWPHAPPPPPPPPEPKKKAKATGAKREPAGGPDAPNKHANHEAAYSPDAAEPANKHAKHEAEAELDAPREQAKAAAEDEWPEIDDEGEAEAAADAEAEAVPKASAPPVPRDETLPAEAQPPTDEPLPAAPPKQLENQGWGGKALVPPTQQPSCKFCRTFLDPFAKGVRLLRKSPPVFCCGTCNSKTTTLAKVFGHWPIDEFKQLTVEEQSTFFQTCGTGQDSIKKAVHEQVMKKWAHQKTNKVSGDFMPEWYWRNQGMPEETVKRMKDLAPGEEHPIFGDTFQVMVHGTSESATEELARQQMVSAATRKAKGTAAASSAAAGSGSATETAAAEGPRAALAPAPTSSSSTSDSESSSSESKKKKNKKNKKKKDKKKKKEQRQKEKKKTREVDKRATEKAEKDKLRKQRAAQAAAEKEEKRAKRQTQSDAAKALAKVSPLASSLETALNHSMITDVPKFVTKTAKEALATLKKYAQEAEEAIKTHDPQPLSFKLEEVISDARAAQDSHDKLANVLKSVEQAAK
eukprot:9450744-Pyramimonas_sp.AAC.2